MSKSGFNYNDYVLMLIFALSLFSIEMISHNAFADTIVTSIPVGSNPANIAVNSNTNKIFVSDGSELKVIDGTTNNIISTIPFENSRSTVVTVNPTTNMIYVVNYDANAVFVIDGETNNVLSTISVTCPLSGVISPVTNMLYVTHACNDNSVTVIDGSTNAIVTKISTISSSGDVAVNPNTNMVYVTSTGYSNGPVGRLIVIDGATNTMIQRIIVGTAGGAVSVDPSTNMIYMTDQMYVHVIDGSTNNELTKIKLSDTPTDIAVNPNTSRIYVSTSNAGIINVIDGMTNAIVENISIANPASIAVNQDTNTIYVSDTQDDAVVVIDGNPPQNTKSTLIVNSADLSGNSFDGMWAELWQNGEIIQEGPTPFSAEIQSGSEYEVYMNDWKNITFDHWDDDSTDARRVFNMSENTAFTAFFSTNNPPGAGDDSAETTINNPVMIDVLANDSDPDGDTLTVDTITIEPEHGSVKINPDNTITYTPDFAYIGSDSFDYQMSDGNGGTDNAIVSITVNAVQIPSLPL